MGKNIAPKVGLPCLASREDGLLWKTDFFCHKGKYFFEVLLGFQDSTSDVCVI